MPIVLTNFETTQDPTTLYISVSVPNITIKADVYSNKCYIKCHFPPYFFELDLDQEIDPLSSTAAVGDGKVVYTLKKRNPGIWNEIKYTRDDRIERRKQAQEEYIQEMENLKAAKIAQKREKEREMVKRQMKVEQENRKEIASLKEKELNMAQQHIQQWVERGEVNEVEEDLQEYQHSETVEEESSDDDIDVEAIRAKIKKQRAPAELPPPRSQQTTSIAVSFTSRGLIPTKTARETEDAKWLTRIKLSKAIHQKLDQSKPDIMKQKAIEFFKLGDYESALNGFTSALEADPADISIVSNRAATLLKLEKYQECIDQCITGLELIQREEDILKDELKQSDGHEDQRRQLKCKFLVRLDQGLQQYEKAVSLDPQNESLIRDFENLKATAIQSS